MILGPENDSLFDTDLLSEPHSFGRKNNYRPAANVGWFDSRQRLTRKELSKTVTKVSLV